MPWFSIGWFLGFLITMLALVYMIEKEHPLDTRSPFDILGVALISLACLMVWPLLLGILIVGWPCVRIYELVRRRRTRSLPLKLDA